MARKKPYTTKGLFNTICDILREKGKMPDGLESVSETGVRKRIRTCKFDFVNDLSYGISDSSLCMDIGICIIGNDPKGHLVETLNLGTFKARDNGPDALRMMTNLVADFYEEGTAFVKANIQDFTWTGTNANTGIESGVTD